MADENHTDLSKLDQATLTVSQSVLQPKPQDWHQADIIAALRKQGTTLSETLSPGWFSFQHFG